MAKEYWIVSVDREENAGCFAFIMVLIGGGWIIKRFLSIDSNLLSWSMFVPEGVIHFFNLPFHYWFLIAITVQFCIFVPLLIITKLGEESSVVPLIIYLIPLLLFWMIIGIMYGFKHYFSAYGFFPSILIGLKTMWYSSVGFFSAASTGISWINLTIGFIVLLLLIFIALILACQILFDILTITRFLDLSQNIGMNDIGANSLALLAFIFISWAIFSVGGVLWLLLT